VLNELIVLQRRICALDLETTGVNPNTDRIIQIGVIRIEVDGTLKEGVQLVNPGCPIPPESTAVHGITNEMVQDKPRFETLAPGLFAGLKEADLCGFNISFDIRFLIAEFSRHKFDYKPGKIIDGMKIFHKYYRRDLSAAHREYCGEPFEGAHDALADARAALNVICAQLRRHTDLPRNVDDLHREFFETVAPGKVDVAGKLAWKNGKASINFGKHTGVPLDLVPKSYLEWMLTGDFPEETKEIIRNALKGVYPTPK
jgi:DNA polymerase-3 subunit epsilon